MSKLNWWESINSARLHLLAVGMKSATRALKTRLINQHNFWNESQQRALFAREVAKRMKLDPGLAFLGGLLHQSPPGFQKLIRVAQRSHAFDLTDVCRTVDAERMKLAEGYEIPNHLSQLPGQTQRPMELSEV